ncbi:hypothetical protein BN1048_00950 [Jeotgalicoccus saudimassiliensis]|uniref:Uncharacterized protein n=1 Tax=Jeotgalicoccus saudimassiliensis TaxID=1461582 RepID=A0A078M4Y6_9STAP|nr:hypothetical protein [Jeotgalicoccus saudimassiliensis]CEA00412.1 hypothetical protein BN1048_00950 [Jeotgalicoccus saudimassiliensis]
MSDNNISNIKVFINQVDEFNELNSADQIIAEQNLRNLLGEFNLIIDRELTQSDDFLGTFFSELLGIDHAEARNLSESVKSKDALHFINYRSGIKGTQYLNYHNFIQPVNILVIDFKELLNSQEIYAEQPVSTHSESIDKTLVLLADSTETQNIYDNCILPGYGEDVYVIVVDKFSLPSAVKTINNQRSSVLIHDFDSSSVSPVIEYGKLTDKYDSIYKTINEDIKEKSANTKTFNERLTDFEKHISGIREKKAMLKNLAAENKQSIDQLINQQLDDDLTVEKLLEQIETQGIKMKKKEQKAFTEHVLMEKVEIINAEVRGKIEHFNEKTDEAIDNIEHEFIKVSGLKFGNNSKNWFVTGLAGLGSSGALALYMSSFGKLGSSALLTKASGLLASFGMLKAGAAAAFLASPLGLTLSATIGAGMVFKSITGWKKGLAKHIRKTAAKKVIPDFKNYNHQLWDETEAAVAAGFNTMIAESREHFIEQNKALIDKGRMGEIDGITSV